MFDTIIAFRKKYIETLTARRRGILTIVAGLLVAVFQYVWWLVFEEVRTGLVAVAVLCIGYGLWMLLSGRHTKSR